MSVTTFPIGYRGMQSLQPVSEHENIIQVPYDFMLSSVKAKAESTLFRRFAPHVDKLVSGSDDDVALVLYLLEFAIGHRTEHTFYRPYFDLLPEDLDAYSSWPVTWTDAEAEEWLGESSYAYEIRQSQVRDFRGDYDAVRAHVEDFDYSYEEFLWARIVVVSRCFDDKRDGYGVVLVPFADMLNHAPPTPPNVDRKGNTAEWTFDDEKDLFIMYSIVPIEPSQELTINYDPNCNSLNLCYYGFTMPNLFDLTYVRCCFDQLFFFC